MNWRALAVGAGLAGALTAAAAGCSGPSKPAPTIPTTTVPATTTTVTVAGVQTSGIRTVLSPIGLNIRQAPSKEAKILAGVAQGSELTVTGHTASAGGWYQVKGRTVTGWITADPSLTAEGKFSSFSSSPLGFSVLYPDTWTAKEGALAAVFKAPSGPDTVTVTPAKAVALLGHGRAGYVLADREQIVACGVTTTLDSYTADAAPGVYLAQVRIKVSAGHALGIDGLVTGLAGLAVMRDFTNSITFASPLCQG